MVTPDMRSEVIEEETALSTDAPSDVRKLLSGLLWGGLAVTILSGWFIITRLGFAHDLRVWDVIAIRVGEGAILLAPALLVGKSRLPPQAWSEGLLLSLLWGAPFILLVAVGIELTSATLASSIAPALMPVFAGMIGWFVLGEKPTKLKAFGYGSICAGLIALVSSYSTAKGATNLGGVASLVVASAMWAVYTLRFRRSNIRPLQAAALICFWSAVMYLPFYCALGLSRLAQASVHELVIQSLYQGLLMSVVAILSFNRAVNLLGQSAAAAIMALVPVVASILAIQILNESPSVATAIAILVIATGVVLAAGVTQAKAVPSSSRRSA
jgi:drug/metabolite transporter (DMT)-like permease